jgi:hypothetical protein
MIGVSASVNHLIDPELKDNAWAATEIMNNYYYGGAESLLDGKDPETIRLYATGNQPVSKYKRMFRKLAKTGSSVAATDGNPVMPTGGAGIPLKDMSGIDWQPLALMNQPLNSGIAIVTKMPIYVKCTAIDPLAKSKKEQDLDFIRNRPFLDAHLTQIAAMMGTPIGSPPIPNASSDTVDLSNVKLNPFNEDELNFYMSLYYKLRPESAFENLLYALTYIQDLKKVIDLEARDQFYYAVSCNQALYSAMTNLPSVNYLYPGDVFTPKSQLQDYSDQPFRYISMNLNMGQLMDRFGAELDEDTLNKIFDTNYEMTGKKGTWSSLPDGSYEKCSATVPVIYMEFKSWDVLNFHKKTSSNGYTISERVAYNYKLQYRDNHPDKTKRGQEKPASSEEYINTKYVQQTYTGYWLPSYTDYVFDYKKLQCSYREAGRESMSPFSINIWKSQEKSTVELCIPLIDDAQKASYKMQHVIVQSKPKGMFVDTKYMRQAVQNLVNTDLKFTMKDLFNMLIDNNWFIGDSEGMDPQELQSGAKPFYEIPGGVGNEIEGYLLVIRDAMEKISKLTGINDVLTGQSPTVDALVGVQKLMLQSGMNSLNFAQVARRNQIETVLRVWASQIQMILKKKGTKAAKTLEAIASNYKIDVIRDLYEIPLHQYGIKVEDVPTEEQQAELNIMMQELLRAGAITGSDWATLKRVFNYKDAAQLMSIREKRTNEDQRRREAEAQQTALQARQIDANAKLQVKQMDNEAELQKEITKGQIQKWLAQYQLQADLMLQQATTAGKTSMQRERIAGQLEKVRQSAAANQSAPLPASV